MQRKLKGLKKEKMGNLISKKQPEIGLIDKVVKQVITEK